MSEGSKVTPIGTPNSEGFQDAKIEVTYDGKIYTKKSTVFPDHWTSDDVKLEVEYTYNNREYKVVNKPKQGEATMQLEGKTRGGTTIRSLTG